MNYKDVETVFSPQQLRTLVIQTGKSVQEITKAALKTHPNDFELWNHAHTEVGTLKSIEKVDSTYGYQMLVNFEKQNQSDIRFGDSTKSNRSIFFNDNGTTFDRWNSYIGKRCIFYIGYSENEKDGSAYRNLLDIDLA